MPITPGQVGYAAYMRSLRGEAGEDRWKHQAPHFRAAWEAVAGAIQVLDKREVRGAEAFVFHARSLLDSAAFDEINRAATKAATARFEDIKSAHVALGGRTTGTRDCGGYISRHEASQLAQCSQATVRRAEGDSIRTKHGTLASRNGRSMGVRVLLCEEDVIAWASKRAPAALKRGSSLPEIYGALRAGDNPVDIAIRLGLDLDVVMTAWKECEEALAGWSAAREKEGTD